MARRSQYATCERCKIKAVSSQRNNYKMTGDNSLINSNGINRRDFMKLCAALAATMGLSSKAAAEMAESVSRPQRPPVIWIGAQECTGCTESLLRATHPTVENLVLETISLEYHEVLSAAFGHGSKRINITLWRSTKGNMFWL